MPPKIEAITDEGSAPTVFISYTHDSPAHSRRVLELSNWLRGEGFDCDIDQYHANQDWPAWMERKIEYSDFVLVICTPIYLRRWRNNEKPGVGLGAQWESLLTRQHLYLAPGFNTKFVPVLFEEEHVSSIPTPLTNVTRVIVHDGTEYGRVRDRLLNIAPAAKPPLRTSLAPFSVADGFFSEGLRLSKRRPTRAESAGFDHRSLGLLPCKETVFSNIFPVVYPPQIEVAKVTLKRGARFDQLLQRVWNEEHNIDPPPVDYFIDARVLYRFASESDRVWQLMIQRKMLRSLPPKAASEWAQSDRMADKNQFIKLLNRSLDQLCATPCMSQQLKWSREMRCHLFVAKPATHVGKIRVKAITKESTREVYKVIRDKRSDDPNAIQHWQHQAFRHYFVRFGDRWFLNVIPFWAFTSDGQTHPSRWQKSSSANMRKPEKNRAVLGHVMFWASILCREPDLIRRSEPFRIERPIELELIPSINDDAWINIARDAEREELIADLGLPL